MIWRGRSQELSAVIPFSFFCCLSCPLKVHLNPLCFPSSPSISPSGVCIAVYFSFLYQARDVYISSGPLNSSALLRTTLYHTAPQHHTTSELAAHISRWIHLACLLLVYETSGEHMFLVHTNHKSA